VPAEIEPPELAHVADFAERPREGDWSLRSALVRYAEGQPERVSAVLEQVRRLEAALRPHNKTLERRGPQLWSALETGSPPGSDDETLVELLLVARELDRLGDAVARWALDRTGDRPDAVADAVTAAAAKRLDDLGIPREEPPPRRSGR